MGLNDRDLLLLVFALFLVILFSQRRLRHSLIALLNNFRGGPPTPMHPSPAADGLLLRRRLRKIEN